jgi:hypothetical protein
MSDINDVSISVAKLEVQVTQLEREMKEIKGDIKFIRQKLDQATGGWKVFMMVGGFSAAVGGVIVKLLSLVNWK